MLVRALKVIELNPGHFDGAGGSPLAISLIAAKAQLSVTDMGKDGIMLCVPTRPMAAWIDAIGQGAADLLIWARNNQKADWIWFDPSAAVTEGLPLYPAIGTPAADDAPAAGLSPADPEPKPNPLLPAIRTKTVTSAVRFNGTLVLEEPLRLEDPNASYKRKAYDMLCGHIDVEWYWHTTHHRWQITAMAHGCRVTRNGEKGERITHGWNITDTELGRAAIDALRDRAADHQAQLPPPAI